MWRKDASQIYENGVKMKKYGILTLVLQNYGTRLQSYALCRVLKQILGDNVSVEVVDLDTEWSHRALGIKNIAYRSFRAYGIRFVGYMYNIFRWVMERRKIKKEDHSGDLEKRDLAFFNFNSKIPYAKQKLTFDDIRKGALNDYDEIIVGSDQVWNGIKVGHQDVYMLDYFKKKGLSYAASFGMTSIPPKMFEDYKRRLNNFSTLLIREKEGLELCCRLGRKDAEFVLDPTLLLPSNEYEQFLGEKNIVDGDYILVYSLNFSYKIYNQAYKFAKRNNCKMIVLKRYFCPPSIKKYPGAEEFYAVSPEGFLGLIKKAKCVITNSYHAMLFSINFNKDFYLYLDNSDEENSRMLTLISLCNLQDRVFWEKGNLPQMITKIDYLETNEVLNREREKSLSLLKQSLNI